jgi:hypothetical protein
MIYLALHSCDWFADIRVTWQIGVTSMNALEERFVMIKAGVIGLGLSLIRAATGHVREFVAGMNGFGCRSLP